MYCFWDKHREDSSAVYIAADCYKNARGIALLNSEGAFDFTDNPFIDIAGHMCRKDRGNTGEPILTEHFGVLDIEQLAELKLLWFWCTDMDCESDDIEILDSNDCKCRKCGNTFEIPYI